MVTPFKQNGDVDYEAFAYNIEKWNDDNLTGYLVSGSNSEACYISTEESIELLKIAKQKAKPDRIVMMGTGQESLWATLKFTNECAKAGADYALVLTPCYYDASMSSEVLINFFTTVADQSEIPILIYNVPKFTHVNIKADAVAKLADHPNIVGMKDSTGDIQQLATFKRVTAGKDFEIIVGTSNSWFSAIGIEVIAGIHASANCLPNACAEVQVAYDAGDFDRALAIHQVIFPLNVAVTATYGIAGLKYACDLQGYKGGFPRRPLLPVSEESKAAIRDLLAVTNEKLAALGVK